MNATLRACLWMTGAILSFTLMAVAGREVSLDLDTFEIMLFRSLIGIGVVLSFAGLTGTWRQISCQQLPLHFIRNLGHFAGQNLWFYALTVLPLAQVFALEFTTPFWVMVLAPLVLGEALTKNRILAALVGFIGILVVTRPNPSSFEIGQLAAAAAAIGFAASAVFTRLLTRRQSVTCILFWLTVIQAIFGLICAGFDGQIRVPSTESLPWVVVIALAGLLAHYCITTALSLAPASVVIPVDFARLPIIAIVGMIFYHEPFEVFVLLGALIIFGANYANIRFEIREKPVT